MLCHDTPVVCARHAYQCAILLFDAHAAPDDQMCMMLGDHRNVKSTNRCSAISGSDLPVGALYASKIWYLGDFGGSKQVLLRGKKLDGILQKVRVATRLQA